jgi:HNH endonuclease
VRHLRIRASLAERFWAKVVRPADGDGCWGWRGCTVKKYGYIQKGRRGEGRIYAHRVSWMLHNGPVPHGFQVLHRCDNPPCSNPLHLFLGTPKDNSIDMSLKGRSGAPKGNAHPRRKLDSSQVLEIRKRYGTETNKKLAVEFGVCAPQICLIGNRKSWRSLPDAS